MIRISESGIGRAIVMLDGIPDGVPRAAMAAINKTIAGYRTDAKKEVVKRYEVGARAVHKSIEISRANKSALSAFALSQGKPISLSKFKVKPKRVQRKGRNNKKIAVAVKKGGKMTTLNRAFIVQYKSEHLGVAERETRNRYPIKELYGPSIPKMLENEGVMRTLEGYAEDRLRKNLDHEVYRIMKGYGK